MTKSKPKPIKLLRCQTCQDKAFSNWRHNSIHFTFPNGNHLSTVWGVGTYSENHFLMGMEKWNEFLNSNNCEVMFDCPKSLEKKILKYFKTDLQPLGYLEMKDFIWLFNQLSGSLR